MMQPCASAAKLRGGGPSLTCGVEAVGSAGSPPPRTVHGDAPRPRRAPDESGAKRREKGLAKAGNARVRRGMIQLAWRFLRFQEASALAQWYRARTADARAGTRKTLIVALAR